MYVILHQTKYNHHYFIPFLHAEGFIAKPSSHFYLWQFPGLDHRTELICSNPKPSVFEHISCCSKARLLLALRSSAELGRGRALPEEPNAEAMTLAVWEDMVLADVLTWSGPSTSWKLEQIQQFYHQPGLWA